jgi:hypothetical protein
MRTPRLYLCEGFCPVFGQIRSLIKAHGFGDAKTQFWLTHRVQATHVSLER